MKTVNSDFDLRDLRVLEATSPDADERDVKDISDNETFELNFEPIEGYSNGPGRHETLDDFKNDGGPDGWPGGGKLDCEVWGTREDDTIDDTSETKDTHYYGFAGDDDIQAGTGDDHMFGGLGDDLLQGGGGDDTVVGDDGDDNLLGNSGNDELHAGVGADVLIGGWHDDTIFLVDDGMQDTIMFEKNDGFDIVDNFELGVDRFILGFGFEFENFAEVDALITYNAMGDQAMLSLGGGDTVIFTGLDGTLGAADFDM